MVTDLLMTLAGHLTFQDMVGLVTRGPSPATLAALQVPTQQFIRERLLQGAEPTREAVEAALLRLADHWYPHLEEAARLASVRPGVDYQESVHYFLSSRPAELVLLCLQPDTQQFTARASEEVRSLAGELVALSLHCFTDGQASLERVVRDRLSVLTEDVGELIRNWTVNSALGHLRSFLAGVEAGPAQVERWVVTEDCSPARQQARRARLAARQDSQAIQAGSEGVTTASAGEPMETGSPAPAPVTAPAAPVLTRTEVPPPEQQAAFPATLLAVPTLPAPARPALAELAALPAAWLPIIAADQAEQRQTRSNLPHSDAYLAGQPSKRRRLNAESKPPAGGVGALVEQALQEAEQQTGLEAGPGAGQQLAADPGILDTVEQMVRQTFEERSRDSQNFTAERFPALDRFAGKQ